MAVLPPPPIREPIIMGDNDLVSPVWVLWFNKFFLGVSNALPNDESPAFDDLPCCNNNP